MKIMMPMYKYLQPDAGWAGTHLVSKIDPNGCMIIGTTLRLALVLRPLVWPSSPAEEIIIRLLIWVCVVSFLILSQC
jgi:hypothetical protein